MNGGGLRRGGGGLPARRMVPVEGFAAEVGPF
jgi:hypothetical protein